jgi:hypothetical protein
MIMRVLRLEVLVYNVCITNQSNKVFSGGGGGEEKTLVEATVNSKEDS